MSTRALRIVSSDLRNVRAASSSSTTRFLSASQSWLAWVLPALSSDSLASSSANLFSWIPAPQSFAHSIHFVHPVVAALKFPHRKIAGV